MANPPQRGNNGRPRNSWMCPNHIDQELQALDSSARNSAKAQSSDGRTHKVRRPKNARIVDTALRRGFVNNGLVEIENEPTDDEEEEEAEKESFGVVYRIPERGVKLDFIDRVKRLASKDFLYTCRAEILIGLIVKYRYHWRNKNLLYELAMTVSYVWWLQRGHRRSLSINVP